MVGIAALLVAWIATGSFAAVVLRGAAEHRRSVIATATTLLMVVGPATLCRFTDDLRIAVVLTAGVLGGLAIPLARASRQVVPPAIARRIAPWAIVTAALCLLGVALTAVQGHFWDENAAHFAVSHAIARGLMPPEHPLFPGEPFRYHYAFNVLVGEVRAFSGCRITTAIDTVTIGCFGLLLLAAADAGRALAGRLGASLAIVLVPMGAGTLQYLLFRDFGAIELGWDALPQRWLTSIPPPVISNFFQHPQGVAMPASLAVLLLFDDADRPHATRRRLLGAALLGMLSLAHVVYFGILGLAIGATVLIGGVRRNEQAPTLLVLTALAGALGIAVALGGFFAPGGQSSNLLTLTRDFFDEPPAARLAHHLVLFGLPLLALPFAVMRVGGAASPLRLAVLIAVAVGFAVPNLMAYQRSWDIVKFLGVAAFFANLLLADVLAALASRRRAFAAVTAVAVILSVSTSTLWLLRTSVFDGRLGIAKMHFTEPPAIAEAVGERLGPLVGTRQRVLSTNVDISKGTGFLTPGFSWRRFGSGYLMDRARCEALERNLASARRDLAAHDLDALDVDFLILGDGDIASLTPTGKANLADPERFTPLFDVSATDGLRHIWQIRRSR